MYRMSKAALLSVSDKTGLVELARFLEAEGYTLLVTSGTGSYLQGEGITCTSIESYTGQKEILDGRVKTLHPKIHAGLLARRDVPEHLKQLSDDEILPIDVAVINLYPFIENLNKDVANNPAEMIELVDIGGPTMIRAAAKNFQSIYATIDPLDYPAVQDCISSKSSLSESDKLNVRRGLAAKVFTTLADYNLQIANYFSATGIDDEGELCCSSDQDRQLAPVTGGVYRRRQELRYGENPHQKAAFYTPVNDSKVGWEQLNGKELSYNNLLDFDAALGMVKSLSSERPAAVLVKHLNPCGAAYGADLCAAIRAAKLTDPRSHFGGIVALNQVVSLDAADSICEDFAEIVVAPGYTEEALERFSKKKNLRVVQADFGRSPGFSVRSAAGGVLVQEEDPGASLVDRAEQVSSRKVSQEEAADLTLAWSLCAHVKSNAIVIARDGMLISVGAGQMSRIDAVEVALAKAGIHNHDLNGSVVASDAFFPFTDCLEVLAAQGVTAVIAPGGARRDREVIESANELGISLLFAPTRHFRH